MFEFLQSRGAQLFLSYSFDWISTLVLFALFTLDKGLFKQEFSLTNLAISHPFAEKERVPFQYAIIIAGVAPLVIILLLTVLRRRFWEAHVTVLALVLSLALTTTITDLLKISVGRPRPDLISRCMAAVDAVDPFRGMSNYTICNQPSNSILNDGFKSFPSGHSSFSFGGLSFLSLYLAGQLGIFDKLGRAWKLWIIMIPLGGAAAIAVSRLEDYRHNPTDVIAGGILGTVISYLTYRTYYPSLSSPTSHIPHPPRNFDKPAPEILPLSRPRNDQDGGHQFVSLPTTTD